jgi:hypothetical protein
MKSIYRISAPIFLLVMLAACSQDYDYDEIAQSAKEQEQVTKFDILVTRDGKVVANNGIGSTRGADVSAGSMEANMNPDIPFGIIGVDPESKKVLINNEMVYSKGGGNYEISFNNKWWKDAEAIDISAYYPHVGDVIYGHENATYTIPYEASELDAGPLVSNYVKAAVDNMDLIPLVFKHISNDIGFKICDVTPDKQLQGLMHLRKLTACNFASSGFYVDTLGLGRGEWRAQSVYRDVVIFDGDELVGVGSDNEMHVGLNSLSKTFSGAHRFYAVPDVIKLGFQFVEVVYDVDEFHVGNTVYHPLKNQVAKYMIYGLLPGNKCQDGKQYTFHIGLDLTNVYKQITFSADVADWETKIYENNDDF